MKLKEIYKNGGTAWTQKMGNIKIENDPKKFKMYKKLGLDVFEETEKKKKA